MKKISVILLFTFVTYLISCTQKAPVLHTGVWKIELNAPGGKLPFGLELIKNADSITYSAYALNGDERLAMDTARIVGDSLHVPMSVFEAEIVGKIGDSTFTGYWKKHRKGAEWVQMNLNGTWQGEKPFTRFENIQTPTIQVSGKWATTFVSNGGDTTVAVGLFNQTGNVLKGTFLTTTGDYRFLAGNVSGDSLFLSCFDGTHLYLFKAKQVDNQLVGKFWSSVGKPENWVATKNEKAALPDEKSLTFLKKGFDRVSFSFPDVTGKKVSLEDEKYKGKVVVVQIMGSWCSNCMDESLFLAPYYAKNKNRGIEIVGLCYEKRADLATSAPKILRMKQRFGIEYELLLAGTNDKAEASATLPMINAVLGFPTTIFIDKKGKVREIHTGFSGPGTGEYYDKFVENFEKLMDKMIAE